MIIKVNGEQPFQVLSTSFLISPSESGYDLMFSADGQSYSKLFTVGANTNRQVTQVAAGSYYFLSGNTSELTVNWFGNCVSEGSGGGSYVLPAATAEVLGGVKIGSGITVDSAGTISAHEYSLPTATDNVLGGVKIGSGLTIDSNGVLSSEGGGTQYTAGSGISISGETISVKAGEGLAFSGDTLVVSGVSGGDMTVLKSVAELPVSAGTGDVVSQYVPTVGYWYEDSSMYYRLTDSENTANKEQVLMGTIPSNDGTIYFGLYWNDGWYISIGGDSDLTGNDDASLSNVLSGDTLTGTFFIYNDDTGEDDEFSFTFGGGIYEGNNINLHINITDTEDNERNELISYNELGPEFGLYQYHGEEEGWKSLTDKVFYINDMFGGINYSDLADFVFQYNDGYGGLLSGYPVDNTHIYVWMAQDFQGAFDPGSEMKGYVEVFPVQFFDAEGTDAVWLTGTYSKGGQTGGRVMTLRVGLTENGGFYACGIENNSLREHVVRLRFGNDDRGGLTYDADNDEFIYDSDTVATGDTTTYLEDLVDYLFTMSLKNGELFDESIYVDNWQELSVISGNVTTTYIRPTVSFKPISYTDGEHNFIWEITYVYTDWKLKIDIPEEENGGINLRISAI